MSQNIGVTPETAKSAESKFSVNNRLQSASKLPENLLQSLEVAQRGCFCCAEPSLIGCRALCRCRSDYSLVVAVSRMSGVVLVIFDSLRLCHQECWNSPYCRQDVVPWRISQLRLLFLLGIGHHGRKNNRECFGGGGGDGGRT